MTEKRDEPVKAGMRCYQLGPLLYVPSYNEPGVYVGPGRVRRSIVGLLDAGAQPVIRHLWKRYYLGDGDDAR